MSDLSRRMDALYTRKVIKPHGERVLLTALDLLGTLKFLTPVDTGRARANWHMELDAPQIRLFEPGQEAPVIFTPGTAVSKSNPAAFVSNNLPYIRRLNEGHSKQAPAGFVEDAIATVKRRNR